MATVRRSKKGGIQDLVFIMTSLLVISIIALVGFKFMDELNTQFQASDDIDSRGKTASGQLRNMYPTVIDGGIMFLLVGLFVVSIILAMLVAIHPIFFLLYFVFLIVTIFIAGIMSNIYQEAAANPQLASLSAELVFTSHILQYLPVIIGVFGFILAIVLYRTYQQSI